MALTETAQFLASRGPSGPIETETERVPNRLALSIALAQATFHTALEYQVAVSRYRFDHRARQ
jgi:hypothetical protein